MRTQSYVPAPRRGRPSGSHYWYLSVGRTQAGFTIHERRGQTRRWLALIADETEAWDFAERRAKLPWRIPPTRDASGAPQQPPS